MLALLLGSCAPVPSLFERIIASGELRIVTRNSPTTYFVGGADEPRGIEYDLARGFAERIGVRLVLLTSERLPDLLPQVADGTVHIAAPGLQTDPAAYAGLMPGPEYQSVQPLVIYRMGGNRPTSLTDLAAGRLDVVQGSSAVPKLIAARAYEPELKWNERRAGSAEMLIRGVAGGGIDYAIVPSNEFALLQHYYPEATVAFALEEDSRARWIMPGNAPRLREAVASYFAEIAATGELNAILDSNSHGLDEFDFVGSRAFVRHLQQRFPRYQEYFKLAAAETGLDWRLIAAIAYQESHWNERAVSPTGVRGLMMLTEHSAEIVGVADRNDPWQSILGGSRYMRRVLDKFPGRIPEEDRMWMAAAAYNIGFGHVEDARVITEIQGGNPDSWLDVRERLPLLADESWYSRVRRGYAPGNIPVAYVENVRRYLSLLNGMSGTRLSNDVAARARALYPVRIADQV